MGLEPDPFISKPMDFREKTDRDTVNFFVEKMAKINEILKKQMAFAQASYEHYANVHKQNAPNYVLSDKMWLDTRNMHTKRSSKKLSDKWGCTQLKTAPSRYEIANNIFFCRELR